MKRCFIPLALLFICHTVTAQQKAVTETGEEVLLFDDNTWKYVNGNDTELEAKTIPVNTTPYVKSKNAGFLLKSTKAGMGIWLDTKKWQFKKAVQNEQAEYEFQAKQGDLYGMLISEKVEIPLESLRKIAFNNAQKAAPDIKIIKEEYRTVNGKKVLLMQMNGTITGIKFVYYGYYYSNEKGTVQFISYTSQNVFNEVRANAEEFINGLVTLEE